ncbi:MAG TPA: polynucleotide kinase-phosphatase [Acidimicrobiales bacterium]|nr:polynucleotide kinase-phosphatase [Acidimicrobiales bacterium]
MNLKIPDLSLVVLIGVTGSGKSTFAARHFRPTEVLSSDYCRGLVSDDENDQSVTEAAFEILHFIAAKRLEAGRLMVIDATNVQQESRRSLIALAKEQHVLSVAVVLDVPEEICAARNESRPDRQFGPHVLRNQRSQLRRSMKNLRREGFHRAYFLSGEDEIEAATFEREPLWNDRRSDSGPFDIVGDVHGCHRELVDLLVVLGYEVASDGLSARHPEGRRALFLGDLVDRGPAIPAVLRLVMSMMAEGSAVCLPGNHEVKLVRALNGRNVTRSHGLDQSLDQLAAEPVEFSREVALFIDRLVGHYVLDEGRLVVAHAGLPERMHGRSSGAVRSFALYGDTTGETDEYGLPVRYPWAEDYRGDAMVVYGHTPVPKAEWVNRTICIDTGCVFGGSLTALRYPERELVSVPAHGVYYEPSRPLEPPRETGASRDVMDLDLTDVLGKRIITTGLMSSVTVREENAIAALEIMSRFAVDPRWLVYLPPTMSPTATSDREGLLEHPHEAFAAFRAGDVGRVVCEEKHMGSRAVVVACRDPQVVPRRFGIQSDVPGAIFSRTGRPFFADRSLESAFLHKVRSGLDQAGLWEELGTDWLVLDCELLPWSAKAEELLRQQYASVGSAATSSLAAEAAVVEATRQRGIDLGDLGDRVRERALMAAAFVDAYRRYCWPVDGLEGLQLAPFQILAGEPEVFALREHAWHLATLARLAETDPETFKMTASIVVDLDDPVSVDVGTAWWEDLTGRGGEGMVVKPARTVVRGPKGLVQPGIKCRGREYLRIIYGPEYTAEQHLSRLRSRGLGHKRSLAVREFSLGIEALQRFVAAEPLYRVHECVFGVLALESEPVDPRL